MEHRTEVRKDLNTTGTWTFLCLDCPRMGGDSPEVEAHREAAEHRADPVQVKAEPWTPDKHPLPGYRGRR